MIYSAESKFRMANALIVVAMTLMTIIATVTDVARGFLWLMGRGPP